MIWNNIDLFPSPLTPSVLDKIWIIMFYTLAVFELMNYEYIFPVCTEYFSM